MVALTEKRYDMALRFYLGLFIFNPFGVVGRKLCICPLLEIIFLKNYRWV